MKIEDVNCPECNRKIPLEDINISLDLAVCKSCGEEFEYSELRDSIEYEKELAECISSPPAGTWHREESDNIIIGATTRFIGVFFMIFFTFAWTGFSILIINKTFNIIGFPFFAISAYMIMLCLMLSCGKVQIKINKDSKKISVFTGVMGIGKYKTIYLKDIEAIEDADLDHKNYNKHPDLGKQSEGIIILYKKKIYRFATMLSTNRKYYIMVMLKEILAKL